MELAGKTLLRHLLTDCLPHSSTDPAASAGPLACETADDLWPACQHLHWLYYTHSYLQQRSSIFHSHTTDSGHYNHRSTAGFLELGGESVLLVYYFHGWQTLIIHISASIQLQLQCRILGTWWFVRICPHVKSGANAIKRSVKKSRNLVENMFSVYHLACVKCGATTIKGSVKISRNLVENLC